MPVPSIYREGYAKARLVAPDLADNFMRHTMLGDPLADAATESLAGFDRIDAHHLVRACMDDDDEAMRAAPLALRDFFEAVGAAPAWVDERAMAPGRAAYHDNVYEFVLGLVAGSIVRGYATTICKPFAFSGRTLASGRQRYRQNMRHILEIMLPGGLARTGEGWKLSVRTRLIHAQVRRLLLQSGAWNIEEQGWPLSAAHVFMAAALFSARNPAADEVHGLHYLWFLYNLLFIMAGFAALVRLGLRFHHPVWLACIPLSAVLLYPMEQPFIGADQTGNMVIPDLKVLAYYALFFLVGVFLQNRDVTPRRSWSLLLLPALLVAFPAALYLIYLAWPADATLEAFTGRRPGSDRLWAAAAAAEAAYAWLMCFGTMGFFRLVAARPRRWVQSVSEASYWVYWAHYPLVVWLQIQVVDWPLNPHLKLLVVTTVTLALLLGLYPLVRQTPIGTMLNGRRRAARTPPPASPAS